MHHIVKRDKILHKIQNLLAKHKKVTGRQLYSMMLSHGAYLPHATQIFGEAVVHVARVVLTDFWCTVHHPGGYPNFVWHTATTAEQPNRRTA